MMRTPSEDFELPTPKRRRRPAKCCTPCRQRKIKCDLGQPCSQCIKSRASLHCTYAKETNRSHVPNVANGSLDSRVIRDSVQGIQRCLSGQDEVFQSSEGTPAQATPILADEIKSTLEDIRQRINKLESNSVHSSPQSPQSTATISSAPCVPQLTPRLRITAEKTKIFDANHWIHTAAQFLAGGIQHKEVEVNVISRLDLPSIWQEFGKMRQIIKRYEAPSLNHPVPEVLSTLPDRAMCDALVTRYMRTCEGMYRILHIPSFNKEYEEFWRDQASSSTIFQMKLLMVIAIGCTFLDKQQERMPYCLTAKTWIYAAQWWLTSPDRKISCSIDELQVACLVQLARQMSALGNSWMSTGTLVQMAHASGLHRDPELFLALSPFQVIMRRRLWATVLELQLESTIDQSSAPPIGQPLYDTLPPGNYNDADISADMDLIPSEAPDVEHTDSSVQRFIHKSFPLRLQIANILQDFMAPQNYDIAVALSQDIKSQQSKAKSFFKAIEPNSRCYIQRTPFQEKFVGLLLHRQLLILHRPFVVQRRRDSQYAVSRRLCLEAAVAVTDYGKDMDIEADKLDEMQCMFVTVTGPLKGPLSLYFIMAIAFEILTQLDEQADATTDILHLTQDSLIGILQRTADQGFPLVQMGRPSLKVHGLLWAILTQIRAVKEKKEPRKEMTKWVKENLHRIRGYMQTKVEAIQREQSAIENMANMTFEDIDMGIFDDNFLMDMSIFFNSADPIRFE